MRRFAPWDCTIAGDGQQALQISSPSRSYHPQPLSTALSPWLLFYQPLHCRLGRRFLLRKTHHCSQYPFPYHLKIPSNRMSSPDGRWSCLRQTGPSFCRSPPMEDHNELGGSGSDTLAYRNGLSPNLTLCGKSSSCDLEGNVVSDLNYNLPQF
jgi:hypothetical protein